MRCITFSSLIASVLVPLISVVMFISIVPFAQASSTSIYNEIFYDVPEYRGCELIDGGCARLLEIVKELILNPNLNEAFEAARAFEMLPVASKALIYKTWYFENPMGEGSYRAFSPASEILKRCKHALILNAFRETMLRYVADNVTIKGLDFEEDSIEDLREKMRMIFAKRLHDFIFTNPNRRHWSMRYSRAISFYRLNYELLDDAYEIDEGEGRRKMKALWTEAEEVIGSVEEETIEGLKGAEYASYSEYTDFIFTGVDYSDPDDNYSDLEYNDILRDVKTEEEAIRALNGPCSIVMTHVTGHDDWNFDTDSDSDISVQALKVEE